MSKPVLRVQDLAVSFTSYAGGLFNRQEREIRAVDGISFELLAGETLGIVGESGSGKSTLARAILGLVKPNRGRVMWLGENLMSYGRFTQPADVVARLNRVTAEQVQRVAEQVLKPRRVSVALVSPDEGALLEPIVRCAASKLE